MKNKLIKLCQHLSINVQDLKWRQEVFLLGLVYFTSGWLVLQIPQSQYGSPFWPPIGIALGALLSFGINRWLGIYWGALLISVFINKVPIYLAIITASSPTIGCILSTHLIINFTKTNYPLERLKHILTFVIISLFVGTTYQSFMGVIVGLILGYVAWGNFLSSVVNWWAGDGIGILVFTPLFLSWSRSWFDLPWQRAKEFLVICLSLFIVANLSLIQSQPVEYLLIPPLLWSAFRLGDKVTYLLLAIVATTAAIATAYDVGVFFKSAQVNNSLVLLQLFIGVVSITTMTVLSIIQENQAANLMLSKQIKLTMEAFTNLDNLNKNLEKIVEERTLEIKQANSEITKLNQQLKAENIRMSSELEITRRLQAMILPTENELKRIQVLDIAGIMKPADEVGGDYYDVLNHYGNIKIGIGDVTGHGLESGVIMIMVQTAVRTLMLQGETDRVKFLSVINQIIYENLQRMQSDRNLSLLLLDYIDHNLYVSGQHESIIIVRKDGRIEEIDTDSYGFPIGLTEDVGDFIAEAQIDLGIDDVVVLYTDGIPEATNQQKQHYGTDRLKQVLAQNYRQSAQQIRSSVITDLQTFINGYKILDDITLVVIKRKATIA